MDNTVDYTNNEAHIATKRNLINDFFYDEDRISELNFQCNMIYATIAMAFGVITMFSIKLIDRVTNDGLANSILSVGFLLFFTILLSSLSYSVFSKMKNIKIERRTLQVKTHNNKKILEQLDLNILEDRLLYAYQELTTKAANNVLNKDIQKQLIKDINKFKEKSNKNNPYSFLRLWSDYVHKCYQSKHQIYN